MGRLADCRHFGHNNICRFTRVINTALTYLINWKFLYYNRTSIKYKNEFTTQL